MVSGFFEEHDGFLRLTQEEMVQFLKIPWETKSFIQVWTKWWLLEQWEVFGTDEDSLGNSEHKVSKEWI